MPRNEDNLAMRTPFCFYTLFYCNVARRQCDRIADDSRLDMGFLLRFRHCLLLSYALINTPSFQAERRNYIKTAALKSSATASVRPFGFMVQIVLKGLGKNLVASGRRIVAGEVPVADRGGLRGLRSLRGLRGWGETAAEGVNRLIDDLHLRLHFLWREKPRDLGAVLLVGEAGVERREWIV